MIAVERAVLVCFLACCAAARAHAATVMVVEPAAPSPSFAETLYRVHGELLSVGLVVEVVPRTGAREPGGSSSRAWLEAVAAKRDADALIDVVGETPAAVDIWVFEKNPRRSEVTRVVAEPDAPNASVRLAIRSVDVLRSLLVEHHLIHEVTPPPPSTVSRTDAVPPPAASGRLGVEVGAALLASLDDTSPAFLPVVRADWVVEPWLALQGEIAGGGSRSTASTATGSARIAEQYALLGGCTCAPSARRLRPAFALSAGVLRTSVDGQADSPWQGHSAATWSALLQVSAGARVRLHAGYDLALAAHAQFAEPYVAVHIADTVVATAGRPNLLLTLAVVGWL